MKRILLLILLLSFPFKAFALSSDAQQHFTPNSLTNWTQSSCFFGTYTLALNNSYPDPNDVSVQNSIIYSTNPQNNCAITLTYTDPAPTGLQQYIKIDVYTAGLGRQIMLSATDGTNVAVAAAGSQNILPYCYSESVSQTTTDYNTWETVFVDTHQLGVIQSVSMVITDNGSMSSGGNFVLFDNLRGENTVYCGTPTSTSTFTITPTYTPASSSTFTNTATKTATMTATNTATTTATNTPTATFVYYAPIALGEFSAGDYQGMGPTFTPTATPTPTSTAQSYIPNAVATFVGGFFTGSGATFTPTATFTPAPGASFGVTVVTVAFQQSSGTNGGTASTGSFHKSPINTIIQNDLSISAISSNTWILPAGTYLISGWQVFGDVQNCQIELYNVGSSSVVATGTNNYSNANAQTTCSLIPQKITFAGSVTLALEYYALATSSTADLGLAASTGNVESYEWVSFTKTQ